MLQHFDIPHDGLSKTFTLSDIDSMGKQLKLIDKSLLACIERKTDFSGNESCALYHAFVSIKDLQNLLKESQEEVNRPTDAKDRISAKSATENNSILDIMIPPKIVALGRIVISFITIDYLPYVASNALSL